MKLQDLRKALRHVPKYWDDLEITKCNFSFMHNVLRLEKQVEYGNEYLLIFGEYEDANPTRPDNTTRD